MDYGAAAELNIKVSNASHDSRRWAHRTAAPARLQQGPLGSRGPGTVISYAVCMEKCLVIPSKFERGVAAPFGRHVSAA